MKILITGHKGYIGAWLVPILQLNKNNILLGMDIGLFEGCEIYPLSKKLGNSLLDFYENNATIFLR